MYKLTIYIFLFLLFGLSSCNNQKKEFWPNGNLKSVITMKGSQYEGTARYYYEDGTLQMECTYEKNKLSGKMTRYYGNGVKQEEQFYHDGKPDGTGTTWDRLGSLASIVNYTDGKLNGIYREWHPNQILKTDGRYLNGMYHGQWLYYNDLGSVVGEGLFDNGTGIQKSFSDNGKIRQVTKYKNNLKEGEEVLYHNDGSVDQIIDYKSGNVAGAVIK